ncbi:myxalamid-type polyketide synthase MxaE and MxaD [Streptomyces eurocidicus]|uniref:Myxalamid-type polyketide synthase MxaE and MxaD n=4 Tax=Streptomyces eurocidicus TaxID=66423 RepID=A0A7W8F1X0_STREU|nr:myxalamid-type polyketide synthase MxaE and MxaD [Streptomyces eurocidicus]
MLTENTDAITRVPSDRYPVADHHDPTGSAPGKTVSPYGGFLDKPFDFDAGFFGISPVEAVTSDPQQRLLLQVVWEALESAGVVPSTLAGSRTGVFVGQATAEYGETIAPAARTVRTAAGTRLRAITAGRVSYALDLRGPSMVLDTACSSSLTAVHTARQSLLTGESDLAIAGGVNIILTPEDSIAYTQGAMMAPDGRCKFGDVSADGFVRSEGVGVVVLKRLADAERDGDPVLAVLRNSVCNNDGRGSGLLLQPAVSGQSEMIHEACRGAGVTPAGLDYVEAHGTGTPVGDDVELRALAEAVADGRPAGRPLPIGSVKSNIGHTEATAGVAGLIKAVLIARHGLIPASLHVRTPHPLLAREDSPLDVVRANRPLEKAGERAVIGVSSFGLSGTNVHAVIAEYVPAPAPDRPEEDATGPHLLVLSARSHTSLRRLARAYAAHLGPAGPGRRHSLRDLCATAATRRDAHTHRLWAVGTTHDGLAATLRALADGTGTPDGGIAEAGFGGPRRTVFVFPGQGSQWLGMGRRMLETSAAFRTAMAACDKAVRDELGWSVLDLLTTATEEFPDDVAVVQPVLWAVEVALAAAWRERGVEPDVCVGHSMGEVAAAQVAGALSVEDAAAVICRRSRLMERVAGRGGMMVVELSADEARRAAAGFGSLCVAVENSPRSTVLAGDPAELRELGRALEGRGVFHRVLKVNVASHSPDMDLIREDLLTALAGLRPARATTGMVSTVRCDRVRGPELDAAYWADNLRRPVEFAETVRSVAKEGEHVFLEVSPHPVLLTAVDDVLRDAGAPVPPVASLRRHEDERLTMARSLGQLFAQGAAVAWERWFSGRGPVVPLPAYPWDTETYRLPAGPERAAPPRARVREFPVAASVAVTSLRGLAPIPPAYYVAAVLDTARTGDEGDDGRHVLADVRLGEEFVDVTEGAGVTLRVTVTDDGPAGGARARVEALRPHGDGRPPVLCMTARVRRGDDAWAEAGEGAGELHDALARCRTYLPGAEFERLAVARGYEFGDASRAVAQAWRTEGEAVARMRLAGAAQPALWEAGLQSVAAAYPLAGAPSAATHAYVPVSVDRVEISGELPSEFWSLARFAPDPARAEGRAEVLLLDGEGTVLAAFRGIRMHRIDGAGASLPQRVASLLPRLPEFVVGVPSVATVRGGATALLSHMGSLFEQAAARTAAPAAGTGPAPQAPVAARRPSAAPAMTTTAPVAAPVAAPPVADADPPGPRTGAGTAEERFLAEVAAVLGLPPERIDARRPLRDLGLDSLMAGQLRRRLLTERGVDLSIGRLLGEDSIGGLARSLR